MVRNRDLVLASVVTIAFALVVGVFAAPVSAHAVFVPTLHDDLMYLRSYGADTASYPQALAVSPFGDVYYTHSDYHWWDEVTYDNRVFGVTSSGIEFLNIGAEDYSEFQWPDGLALTGTGNLVVADTSDDGEVDHNRLRIFNSTTGSFVRNIGTYGSGPLGFNQPYGVTVAPDGTIFASEVGNNRIQMVSESGAYIGSWTMPTGAGVNPNGMDFDSEGHLWVAMEGSNRVAEFEPDGTLLRTISTWDETDLDGNYLSTQSLYGPMDVAVDTYGVVYVCDTNNSRIVRFDQNGDWLGTFYGYDTPGGSFDYPVDIDTDAFGNVYVADALRDSVYKFQFLMAEPDTTPPVTSSNINEAWQQGPVTVSLSAYDASLTVEATRYSTDGSEPDTLYTGPFTISDEGTTTVRYYSVDRAENYEAIKSQMVRIDNVAPTTTATFAAETWGLSTTVALQATDSLSGIHNTLYVVDNGSAYYYSGLPFTVWGVGSHTVDFYSFDNAGNIEQIKRIELMINAPDTQAPITQTNIPSGWINTDHSIEVTATDSGSGVARTFVSYDGSTPTSDYAGPLLVQDEGIVTVRYYSTDRAGNVESLKSTQLRIDKTPPTSTSDGLESYVDSATIRFEASDALSGVQSFVYRLDNGDWNNGYSVSTSGWGWHKLVYYAIDRAGNQQAQQTLNFMILQPDAEPPVVGDDIPSAWIRGPVQVTIDAYDVISQVEGVYYSINDGDWITYDGPFSINNQGSNIIRYYARDTRGNESNVVTKELRVDNTPPVSSTNAQPSYLGTAQITLSATDSLSAVASMYYRLDGGEWVAVMPGARITCSTVGDHVLEYYAVDTPSNTEAIKSVSFTITPPDSDPPVTTMSAPSTWVRGPALVSFSAFDELSSVTGTYYSLTGANPPLSLYGSPVSVSAEGTTTITYRSVDFWGNYENTKTGYVRVDNTAPVTSSNAVANYVDRADITLTRSDALSGAKTTYFKIDNGAWQQGTSLTVTGYSYHTVQFYSTDNAGNTEGVKSVTFRINRADRYYEEDDSLLLYRGSWYDQYNGNTKATTSTSADVVVYFQGDRFWYTAYTTPESGIAQLSLDGGPWLDVDLYNKDVKTGQYVWYSGDLEYGYHIVRIRPSGLKNALSSGTEINLDQIRLQGFADEVPDTAPPVTTSNINENWQKGPVSVSLSAVDTTTGVAATYYSTDGGAPDTLYTGPFSVNTDGQNIVKYFSVDRRGNQESVKTQYVRVDNTAPVTTTEPITGFIAAGTVTLNPADTNGSGVATTWWRLNGGSWNSGTLATVPYLVGDHLLEWYSTDSVGNIEAVKSASIPVYARSEQDNTKLRFTGTWFTGTSSSYSGNSYAYTGNGYTDVAFTGTGVRWITTQGQSFGIARVTLNGGTPVLVDLYKGSTSHKQVVWSASGLSGTGVHRLRIEWTGTKNPAASNTYVGVDAIDVVGALQPVDMEPPVTSASAPSSWTQSPAMVTLTATDTVTGVAQTYYRLNGGSQTTYSAPLSISTEGTHTIQYWSVDNRGNTEAPKSVTVRVDDTKPVTTSNVPNGWQHETVNVTLAATDALSGVDAIRYRLNGGALTAYTGPIAVSGDGVHELRFYATDKAGNVETEQVRSVSIDHEAPAVSSDIDSAWQQGPVSVTLTADDAVSGVERTLYTVNGGTEQEYSEPFTLTAEGTHTVEYRAVDRAGNAAQSVTEVVRIDNSAPASASDASDGWYKGSATVALTAQDPLSGVASIKYSVDGGETLTYSEPVVVTGDGTHEMTFWAIDNAGNTEQAETVELKIDATLPMTSSDANAAWQRGPVMVTLTADDARSGVATTYYSIDGGAAQTYSAPFAVTGTGAHTIGFRSVDAVGNSEATRTATVNIDDLAPVTSTDAPATAVFTNTTVRFTATDAHSGVDSTRVRLNGGEWQTASQLTLTEPGRYAIDYRSLDRVGNLETTQSRVAYYLRRLEQDNALLRRSGGTWYTSSSAAYSGGSYSYGSGAGARYDIAFTGTRIDLVATNGTVFGIARITVDNQAPVEIDLYASSTRYKQTIFSASDLAPGLHTVKVEWTGKKNAAASNTYLNLDAVDTDGQLAAVDLEAPVTTSSIPAGWVKGPLSFTLSATDAVAGVASTSVKVGSAPFGSYSTTLTVSAEGETPVSFYSVDSRGNRETTKTATVKIDNTAPATSTNVSSAWQKGPVNVTLTRTDALSGVASTFYAINGGTQQTYTAPFNMTTDGVHTLEFHSVDAAGNVESKTARTVRVDSTAPSTTADIAGTYQDSATIQLAATDAHSGLASTKWRMNGGAWREGTVATSTVAGVNTLEYFSTDQAGNAEPTVSRTFGIMRRTDQTTREVYYQGTWYTGASTSYEGGSYAYLASAGMAEFTFVGTQADWIATKGKIFGIAKVTVDNGAPTFVDLYAATTLYKQKVFSVSGLSNTRHTIKIEWTGTRNSQATNHYINVDALDLVGNFSARRIDQPEKLLYYTGSWTPGSSTLYSGGTYSYLASEGALTITFEGTRAEWVATKGRNFGIAKVTVDGGAPTFVDLYAPSTQYQQTVFSASQLAPGTHTVRIEWTGTKNADATNHYINVDATDLVGRLLGVRYEQNNSLFHMTTNWLTSASASYSGGSYAYTAGPGTGTFTFDGTRAELVAAKGPIFGIAKVSIDGGTPTMVDLYAVSTQYKQTVFTAENLAPGLHTLTVEYTGTKNAAATNNYVNVDSIDLVGRPAYSRLEQTHARVYSQGGWITSNSVSLSGGSYDYAYTNSTKVLAFEGTHVSLVAMKGPIFGRMRVTLDGNPVNVDLYSPTNQYRQTVFTATGLTNGRHVLKVEWTGTANPAATNHYVNLDAIDLVGIPAVYDPVPAPNRYEQDDALITKSGTWLSGTSAGYSGGSYAYASGDASATMAFDGTELSLIGVKGTIFGFAAISLDGGTPVIVDLYNAVSLNQTVLWSTGTLPTGRHTVTVSYVGENNPAATKNYINFDAVDVRGTLVP